MTHGKFEKCVVVFFKECAQPWQARPDARNSGGTIAGLPDQPMHDPPHRPPTELNDTQLATTSTCTIVALSSVCCRNCGNAHASFPCQGLLKALKVCTSKWAPPQHLTMAHFVASDPALARYVNILIGMSSVLESLLCALRTFRGHKDSVLSSSYNHNGKQLASGGADGIVMIWNFSEKTRAFRFAGHKVGLRWVTVALRVYQTNPLNCRYT